MNVNDEKFLVTAAVRNEGAFLLEWVTWYRLLGFEILISYNDCTDDTAHLLGALQEAGWLTCFEHFPAPDEPPKASAMRQTRPRPELKRADWILVCDIDELLVLHKGGMIGGFMDEIGRDFMGVAFHWKCFGIGGWKRYQPGLTHRMFRRAGPSEMTPNIMVKTMFRQPHKFARLGDHAPVSPLPGCGDEFSHLIVDSTGAALPGFAIGVEPSRHTDEDRITHENAQMNHYVLRSAEHFAAKRGTPAASTLKDRYTQHYYKTRNRNDTLDETAMLNEVAFDFAHESALELPMVAYYHHLCCAQYVERLRSAAGRKFQRDKRWKYHMSRAKRALDKAAIGPGSDPE